MLLKRIVTAIIGTLATVYVVSYGQWLFVLVVSLLAVLAWHEFYTMFRNKNISVWFGFGILEILALLGCAWFGSSQEMIFLAFFAAIVLLARTVISFDVFTIDSAALSFLGILYIGFSFSHLILLRYTNTSLVFTTSLGPLAAGVVYLWLVFIGTWANDTFAFFIGSKFGKNKLCPKVSPGKTIEGAGGGIVGSILATIGMGMVFNFPFFHSLIIGILVGISAPMGDLAESVLKRCAGVKDSGHLLPGHGGVLDRFDSIMFTVPIVYYYLHAFVL